MMESNLQILFAVVVPFVLSAALGWLCIPRVMMLSHRKRLFDVPDERKTHNLPVPRLGGLTFLPILLMCVCLVLGMWKLLGFNHINHNLDIVSIRLILLFVGMMMLYLVGVVDDLIGVSYQAKFAVQIVCALLFPLSGLWIHDLGGLFWLHEIPAWLGIPLTVFVAVYVINAMNLIDGIDGLAAGISSVSLLTIGVAAVYVRQPLFLILIFSMLGVLLIFWLYNVYGNIEKGRKIFMGDTGSLSQGYLISFLLVCMSEKAGGTFPDDIFMIALSTMLLPMFDIVRVVMVRKRNHANPFLPDKNHIHHKMLRTGLTPRAVMVTLVLVSLLIVLVTLITLRLDLHPMWAFAAALLVWLVFDAIVNHFVHRNNRQKYE